MRKWAKIEKGKHVGLTLPRALISVPNWFFWLIEHQASYPLSPELYEDLILLEPRARYIKIPRSEDYGNELIAIYGYDGKSKSVYFDIQVQGVILPPDCISKNVIDLGWPSDVVENGKPVSAQTLIKAIRAYDSREQTKTLPLPHEAEAFFSDDSNFILPPTPVPKKPLIDSAKYEVLKRLSGSRPKRIGS